MQTKKLLKKLLDDRQESSTFRESKLNSSLLSDSFFVHGFAGDDHNMLPLLLHAFTSLYVLTATARSAAATEIVVGTAGRKVLLPCRLETASQRGVEVCWGRGEPSLFTCHNAVINAAGDKVSYRRSYRFSLSSSFSLYIFNSRPSDAGFYHCRVQLPGPFNDRTSTVHLIIIDPRPSSSEESAELPETRDTAEPNPPEPNPPRTTAGYSTGDVAHERGSDVSATGPVVALVQSPVEQQGSSLLIFIGNTVRLSLIVFVPAVLLAAAYRVWSRKQASDGRPSQSEEPHEDISSSV
ncbi:hypothetical protein Q5P01_019032 [Channa striata]|uniref:Ig-like domain-containing protein n=1 Tax=Channa striata TaxID=64152 RepID=A0AA88SB64_CHASR|nr:hypothetical protein Q5P01_019032 [Channa striata]